MAINFFMAHTNLNNLYPKPTVTAANTRVSGQSLSVTPGSATSFATAVNTYTNLVLVDVQVGDVVVTFDGTTPVSGVNGHRLTNGTNFTWSTATFNSAKLIAATGTTAYMYATEFQV